VELKKIELNNRSIFVIGNVSLLDNHKTGLFCSRKCPADKIMEAHDQFKIWARDKRTVISGFHSPVEKECLRVFLKSAGNIILCPARGILNMRIRSEWKPLMEAGRLLIISPFDDSIRRASQKIAQKRNEFIKSVSDEIVVVYASAGSLLS